MIYSVTTDSGSCTVYLISFTLNIVFQIVFASTLFIIEFSNERNKIPNCSLASQSQK